VHVFKPHLHARMHTHRIINVMNLKRKALHPHIKVTVEEALNARSPVDFCSFKKKNLSLSLLWTFADILPVVWLLSLNDNPNPYTLNSTTKPWFLQMTSAVMPTPLERMTQGLESIKAQVCVLSLEQSEVHEVPVKTLSFAAFPFRNSFLSFNRPCWDEQIETSRVKSRSNRHLIAPLTWEEIMALVRLMVWVCAQVTTRIYLCIKALAQQCTNVCVYTRPRACVVCMYHTGRCCLHTDACGLQIF
jgi:hypothetical protein